jgi:hypothetical protein
MLFDYHLFPAIMRGEITLTFRNWTRPQAKAGARHRLNADGAIEIRSVALVDASAITGREAKRAGFNSVAGLRAALAQSKPLPASGQVYRIEFRFVREADPRVALAADGVLSPRDAATLATKLDRMDARSAGGPWTRQTLRLIADHPRVLSTVLAKKLGRERLAFKTDVRKLKALGLTISHEVGYEISPRGRAFLEREVPGRRSRTR